MSSRAETNREDREKAHTHGFLHDCQPPASRNPVGNYKQERMDAVSGQEDGRQRADRRVSKIPSQSDKEGEKFFRETMNMMAKRREGPMDNTWQIPPLCHLLK